MIVFLFFPSLPLLPRHRALNLAFFLFSSIKNKKKGRKIFQTMKWNREWEVIQMMSIIIPGVCLLFVLQQRAAQNTHTRALSPVLLDFKGIFELQMALVVVVNQLDLARVRTATEHATWCLIPFFPWNDNLVRFRLWSETANNIHILMMREVEGRERERQR
jgi:hypothetical protein